MTVATPPISSPNISPFTSQLTHTLTLSLSHTNTLSFKNSSTTPLDSPRKRKKPEKYIMGIQLGAVSSNEPHYKTKKLFLFSNYMLLGAASSCIFLTLSLRLIPSLCGFFFISLHLLTILGALAGCHAASQGGSRWFVTHMVTTVLTAIFQGSLSVLIFTRSDDFLAKLKSYVMEENAVVILKLAGGLCVVIFVLEWVVLTVAFFLKYYSVVEGGNSGSVGGGVKRSNKVVSTDEEMGYLPYPSASFHV